MTAAGFRHVFLILATLVGGLTQAAAQQAAKVQAFPTADAAAAALTEAVKNNDRKAIAAMWGADWRDFVPGSDDDMRRRRDAYLAAWEESHKLALSGDNKAVIEVGRSGWTLAVPIVKDGSEWHFDVAAGLKDMVLRRIGRDERAAIQTLLAIVDAQNDYATLDPMKTGVPVYARRLLSSPGRKDGLYWETKPGEPLSPLGPAVASAQADGNSPDGHYGYYFRLLYSKGPAAPGGAHDYIVGGRMIGGFAAQAAERAAAITSFNPDKDWDKADTTLP